MARRPARSRFFPLIAAPLVVFVCGLAVPARANPEIGVDICGLLLPTVEPPAARECLACHQRLSHAGHPYDVHYPRAGSALRMLRPLAEVERRGVPVPDRRITCVTCHDRTSPWKYHLRLPPGSTPTHAVDVNRPATYEEVSVRQLPRPRPGDDVGRKPLCLACHALD